MTSMPEHEGYIGSIEHNDEDEVFHGRLEFIRDLVTYVGVDARSLRQAFREAVDDYLALCREEGRSPGTPLKGGFNVRRGRDLHRRAMILARRKGLNQNTLVSDALRRCFDREDQVA